MLIKAVAKNRKLEAVEHATGTLIAVAHSLDISFNRGKGKIFDKWTEKLLGEDSRPDATFRADRQGKRLYSERFEQFLMKMPRKDS